jgi:pimeloyl-ACP methyl ester carboxylesterase
MPTISANGIDIGYDVHGSGPPLVMLHGAASAGREDWAAQVPLLSKAFRIYLPDARGHATTRGEAAQGITGEMLLADLEGFIDALHLETLHLAGFSMGAMTALWYATRHPERLRTLLVAGIGLEREPRASVARALMNPDRRPATGPLSEAALARRHDPFQGAGAWRSLLVALAADIAGAPGPTPAELHRVELPVLVAVGDRDSFVPVDQAWALARQVPAGRLLVVPDGPHEVMVRHPAIFNAATEAFYRSTAETAGRRAVGRGARDEA